LYLSIQSYEELYDQFIYTSSDLGQTWALTSAPTNLTEWSNIASSADGTKLVAAENVSGDIYTSADSGVTWVPHEVTADFGDSGQFGYNDWSSVASSADGGTLFAMSNLSDYAGPGPLYISKDSGVTWTAVQVSPFGDGVISVASSADGTKVVAACEGIYGSINPSIYASSDSGASWAVSLQSGDYYSSLASSADGTKLVSGGDLVFTQNQEPSLLTLANLCNNIYAGNNGYGDFQFADNNASLLIPITTVGFLANIYTNSDQMVVIDYRGTVPQPVNMTAIDNLIADYGFNTETPTKELQSYAFDAAAVASQVESLYPNATIFLTGHSLGGALAQLVGKASGLPAIGFNAPGSGQVYGPLSDFLGVGNWPSFAGGNANINVDYRLDGDQVSEVGTQIGSTITITEPAYLTLDVNSFSGDILSEFMGGGNYGRILQLHSINTIIAQIADNAQQVMDMVGLNLSQPIENAIQPTSSSPSGPDQYLYTFDPPVTNTTGYLIDPQQTAGADFLFSGNAGSPNVAAINLPSIGGVASYFLRFGKNGVWTDFQLVSPGVAFSFGNSGASSFEFVPLDTNSNPILVSGLVFGLYFISSGNFAGVLTQSSTAPILPPILHISMDRNQIDLSWSTNIASGYDLVATENINPQINWINVTNVPLIVSNQFVVTLPITSKIQLFRLQQ
jgi:hypothetical protein